MKWLLSVFAGMLVVCASACSTYLDNSKYYGPSFRPDGSPFPICPYQTAQVASDLDWIVIFNAPWRLAGCSERNSGHIYMPPGKLLSPSWHAWDGGGVMAGTNYSMRTLFQEDREKEASKREEEEKGQYPAYYDEEFQSSFVSNGLRWDHVVTRFNRTRPKQEDWFVGAPPGPKWTYRIYDVYTYKHPEGWWLRVQGSFRHEMADYPEILASRRDTLRQVVESIRIEPKDPSRVSCRTDDRGREFCRYRWP